MTANIYSNGSGHITNVNLVWQLSRDHIHFKCKQSLVQPLCPAYYFAYIYIYLFPLLIQEDQLSVTGERMCTRLPEFRNFPVPDRFRNRQIILFYEKHTFIGLKNGTFYNSTELNSVRPLAFEIFFLFGPKIHKF